MAWLALLITVPLTLFAVLFAMSNADDVTVRLMYPAAEWKMPLAFLGLGLMGAGFFAGAVFAWMQHQKTRLLLWQETRKSARLERELQTLQEKSAAAPLPALR